MRYYFSTKSELNLLSCHYDLQVIANEALAMGIIDFAVICGHREEERQNRAYEDGNSELKWPDSKHNRIPSEAIDLVPIVNGEIPWDNSEPWFLLAGVFMACAKKWEVKVRWGGYFKLKGKEEKRDLGHFERNE